MPQEHLGEVAGTQRVPCPRPDLERAGVRKRATGKRRSGRPLQEMGLIEREASRGCAGPSRARGAPERLLRGTTGNTKTCWSPPDAAFKGERPTLKLSTGEMILETVRLLQNPNIVRAALGNPNRVLDLSTDPLLRFQKVTLSPTDGYVLSRVDGVMKAREIVEMIPLPQEEVEKSLYGLLVPASSSSRRWWPAGARHAAGVGQPAERGHAGDPVAPVRRRGTGGRGPAQGRRCAPQGNRGPADRDPRGL